MKRIINARNLLSIIDNELDGVKFTASDRFRVAGTLYDITHEHAKAIIVLIENKLYASAFALIRPLFETYVRASWIHHCATENVIEHFIRYGTFKRKVPHMLPELEKKRGLPSTLSDIAKKSLNAMHSYTHGGLFPISRRLKEDEIVSNYEDIEIEEVIQFSSIISFLSFTGIIEMAQSEEKNKKLNELIEWVSNWCFNK